MFSTMDSPSTMEFLEVPLGLTANLFADDLDIEGSILDINFDEGLKKTNAVGQSTLEDFLLPESEDPLGEEWMETLDLEPFLDTVDTIKPVIDVKPLKKVGADVLDISMLLNGSNQIEDKPEPRKEGMKASAFELLKALLTEQKPNKADISLDILQPVKVQELSNISPAVQSPVAEVPFFDFSGYDNIEHTESSVLTFENLIQPEIHVDNNGSVEIDITGLNHNVIQSDIDNVDTSSSFVSSPLSNESESIFSSSPSSPLESSDGFSTIDTSYLSDDSSCTVKSSQVSEESFTKLKSKSKRSKAKTTPYDPDYITGNVSDKRQRKKMQNKNAATRYRVKKRQEKESLQEQEGRLSQKNEELKEKVESLRREIQYMKELMQEISKAKKSKI